MVGPIARLGARGLGPGLKYEIVLRAGPGPHNSICGPGQGQVCTTAAGPGRALASNHVCGPGLGLDFRPVQGPSAYCVRWCARLLLLMRSCVVPMLFYKLDYG